MHYLTDGEVAPEVRLAPDSERNSDLPDGCRLGFELKKNQYIPVDTEAFETSMPGISPSATSTRIPASSS